MSKAPKQPRPLTFHLAVGVAAVCVIAVAVILFRAVTAPPAAGPTGGAEDFSSGVTPEILGEGLGAKGLHIQVMDRDDRTRLSAELWSESLEPLEPQRYAVVQPRATVYLQDGRVVHIRSNSGRLMMPDRQRAPETGTLTDDVVVRLFEPQADGSAPDIERDTPLLTWTGTSLTFDSTLGQASTTQPFELTSEDFEFRAQDATLSINQTLERLERFAVRQGGTLVYTDRGAEPGEADAPAEAGTDTPPTRQASRQGGQNGGKPDAADGQAGDETAVAARPALPIETFYHAAMRGGIVLSRAGQEIASDRLDVFARTIDGKLPEDAILRLDADDAEAEPVDTAEPGQRQGKPAGDRGNGAAGDKPVAVAGDDPGQTPPTTPDGPAETTLVWTGVLEIEPIETQPSQLKDDHLLARFTSEESGVVTFADEASDASGRAAMVEYGFTQAKLVLSGPSQGRSVQVKSPSIGEASMGRIELPLGEGMATGWVDARIPGPFTVIGADGISRIDSGERARLRFAVRDGRLTGELIEAEFVGTAKASDEDSWLESERLLASFVPGEDGRSKLRELVADQSVRMDDGNGGGGRCDNLVTRFDPEAEQPTPQSFVATGHVSFRDQTGKIDADMLRTELRADEDGSIEVVRAWAEGESVVLRRHTDQIDITGTRLFADADAQYLEVEAADGEAKVQRGPTLIAGHIVRLNGLERSAFVEGAGRFEHRSGRGEQASHVAADWQDGMAYSDLEGKVECVGGVHAVHEPDVFTRETIAAELVRVELAPLGEETTPAGEGQPLEAIGDAEREIRTVYAAGRAYFGVGEELATVESATYAGPIASLGADGEPSEAEPALERAFRLSGVEIISDSLAGTLDVPGRGRMFVADLRPVAEGEEGDADRGAALFDWQGSLHANRLEGSAVMQEGVSMSHARASDGMKSLLECATLRISFVPGGQESDELFSGLRSALAETDVYLRTDTREMTAALLAYDPDAGIARALGDDTQAVRVLDRATGSPMTASAMVWDLTSDRVDVVDPGVITIPRN